MFVQWFIMSEQRVFFILGDNTINVIGKTTAAAPAQLPQQRNS